MIGSIPSPGSSGLQLGPFEVHAYGLMYVLGLAAAIAIAVRRWEAAGGSRQTVYDVALWAFPAGLFALYVAGYSGFRIFEETLRVDPAHHILGLRLNLYVAALLCLAGLAWFAYTQGWRPGRRSAR